MQKNRGIATVIIFLIVVIFVGLAFYFNLSKKAKVYTYDSSSIPKSEEIKNSDYSLDKIEKVVGSSKFKVPALGLEMNVLDSWKSIDSESVELPDGFDTPQFLFKKEGTSCIFSYALATESIFQQYKQISWADRVYTKEGQYDSSWYLLKELIPQGFEFLGHDRKPFSKEVRLISDQNLTMYISKGVRQLFLLFSENGGQVSYDCDKDVSSMLATVEHNKYDEQTLDDSKKGVAFFVSKMKDGAYRGSQLLFREDGGINKKILDIENLYRSSLSVYKDKVFFISVLEGSLLSFDIFKKEFTTLVSSALPEKIKINDFYFYKDKLYYLLGDWCNEYRAKCDLELHSFDLKTKADELLASKLSYRKIAGYKESDNSLYMFYTDGDGGCFWGSGARFDFSKKTLIDMGKYGSCDGDKNYKEENQKYEVFSNVRNASVVKVKHIFIGEGKILPPNINSPIENLDEGAFTVTFFNN